MKFDLLRPEIRTAMDSVADSAARAATDPARPLYHFLPPANWMNDPNGTFYYDGFYHLFYQHNPYADTWGDIHWGHARSTDLVHWEELPIALWPSQELGEAHCFSGCAALTQDGQPRLYYTSVSPREDAQHRPNEQWIAIAEDPEWLRWQKHAANPYLALGKNGTPHFDPDWRDPFIFSTNQRHFMVLGATKDDMAGVALFEAVVPGLLEWRYQGWLYQQPRSRVRFFECPNFFAVGDKWILLASPYTPIQYVIGDFDPDDLSFAAQTVGTLDHGADGDTPNFYASNIYWTPDNNTVVAGWVRGFPPDRGWNGCLALPRLFTLGTDGRPRQHPVPQLRSLRGAATRYHERTVTGTEQLPECRGNTFECKFSLRLPRTGRLDLMVGADPAVILSVTPDTITLAGTSVDLSAPPDMDIDIHLFVDRSVVELFACDGAIAITRIITTPDADGALHLAAHDSKAVLSDFGYWQLAP